MNWYFVIDMTVNELTLKMMLGIVLKNNIDLKI